MTIYADTSVLVAFVFDEPDSDRVRNWFGRTTRPIIVSDLARLEFPAVVTRSARTGRLNPSEASAALASFDLLAARSRPLSHDRADFAAAEALSAISRRSSRRPMRCIWRARKTPERHWRRWT